MKAITLRNLPDEVARAIRRRAEREGLSLNKAVLAVLAERLGVAPGATPARYHDLDELAGAWTDAEARAFDRALAAQRGIDPELWGAGGGSA